jgi:hypothetical protein
MNIEQQIRHLLKGIDSDLYPDGWWETSTEADWGALKLQELIQLTKDQKTNLLFKMRVDCRNMGEPLGYLSAIAFVEQELNIDDSINQQHIPKP